MAGIKFIHTADLHLDTPFKGLSTWNRDLADRFRDATFRSYGRIIDLCIRHEVDFLLISGDIFDSDLQSLAAQLRFVSGLKRLSEHGIAVYFICGNHDPLGSWMESLHLPEKVYRFGSEQPETFGYVRDGKLLAHIQGISYREKEMEENLTGRYRLPEERAPFSIALLHGTIGPAGSHRNYAPFRIEDVKDRGFDYWALGHIHKGRIVHEAHPAIAYPGNPQGRDFGEPGAKGCLLVEIEEGIPPGIRFLETHSIRFEEVAVDLSGEEGVDRIPVRINEAIEQTDSYDPQSSYMVRVRLEGRTPLHPALNRPGELEQLTDQFNEGQVHRPNFVLIDRIEPETRPDLDLERVRNAGDFTAEILQFLEEYQGDEDRLNELMGRVEEDFVSPAARRELTSPGPEKRKGILERAKWILLDRLVTETK